MTAGRRNDPDTSWVQGEIAWAYWKPFIAASLTMTVTNQAGYTDINPAWIWAVPTILPFAVFWAALFLATILSALRG